MNEKTLKELQFIEVLNILKKYTFSDTGIEGLNDLCFFSDINSLKYEISLCEEMIFLFKGGYIPPFSYYGNIRKHIFKCEKPGSYLLESDYSEIIQFFAISIDFLKFIKLHKKNCPELYKYIEKVNVDNIRIIFKQFTKCIDENGNIKDKASSKLKICRTRITSLKREINSRLNNIISKKNYEKFIQDKFISIKNGRYTIPIKKDMSSKFQGVIQDESQTGQSVFMEPANIVSLNNKIIAEIFKEEKEIRVILKMLSDTVRKNTRFILKILNIIQKMEIIHVKARFALEYNACFPEISEDNIVYIKNGKHPLLGDNVVPLNLQLTKDKPVLVVSGPNAGGKTVALKTTGLFAFMFQFAIPVPVDASSKFGVFKNIMSDIGDHQSIEKNLSTFSSHIVGLKDIIDNADKNSLVLIDEIATGTDPTQGEALAISMFEYFTSNKIPSIITTHYSGLKYASIACENSENASVGFDLEKMQPTYKFYMGVPGGSNAFSVAANYKLSTKIIERAKEIEKEENKKVNEIIDELKKRCTELEHKNESLNSFRTDLLNKEKELQKLEEKLDKKHKILKKDKIESLENYILEKKKYIEEIINSLSIKNQYKSVYKIKELTTEINKKRKEIIISEYKILDKNEIKQGKKVYLPFLCSCGEIIDIQNEKVKVDCFGKIVHVKINTIAQIPEDIEYNKPNEKEVIDIGASNIKIELNIIGKQCEEAIELVSKYLDQVFLSSLDSVRIIHGKGTGKLRNAVHEYLKYSPVVSSYRIGDMYEGGSGATVVEIKK